MALLVIRELFGFKQVSWPCTDPSLWRLCKNRKSVYIIAARLQEGLSNEHICSKRSIWFSVVAWKKKHWQSNNGPVENMITHANWIAPCERTSASSSPSHQGNHFRDAAFNFTALASKWAEEGRLMPVCSTRVSLPPFSPRHSLVKWNPVWFLSKSVPRNWRCIWAVKLWSTILSKPSKSAFDREIIPGAGCFVGRPAAPPPPFDRRITRTAFVQSKPGNRSGAKASYSVIKRKKSFSQSSVFPSWN